MYVDYDVQYFYRLKGVTSEYSDPWTMEHSDGEQRLLLQSIVETR